VDPAVLNQLLQAVTDLTSHITSLFNGFATLNAEVKDIQNKMNTSKGNNVSPKKVNAVNIVNSPKATLSVNNMVSTSSVSKMLPEVIPVSSATLNYAERLKNSIKKSGGYAGVMKPIPPQLESNNQVVSSSTVIKRGYIHWKCPRNIKLKDRSNFKKVVELTLIECGCFEQIIFFSPIGHQLLEIYFDQDVEKIISKACTDYGFIYSVKVDLLKPRFSTLNANECKVRLVSRLGYLYRQYENPMIRKCILGDFPEEIKQDIIHSKPLSQYPEAVVTPVIVSTVIPTKILTRSSVVENVAGPVEVINSSVIISNVVEKKFIAISDDGVVNSDINLVSAVNSLSGSIATVSIADCSSNDESIALLHPGLPWGDQMELEDELKKRKRNISVETSVSVTDEMNSSYVSGTLCQYHNLPLDEQNVCLECCNSEYNTLLGVVSEVSEKSVDKSATSLS
jgi:hypothetical protein